MGSPSAVTSLRSPVNDAHMSFASSEELFAHITNVSLRVRRALDQVQADASQASDVLALRSLVASVLDAGLQSLAETNLWGVDNRLPSGQLWELAGEQLGKGALLYQARFKPRGYAGDDLMLGRIYEDWRCSDPLGSLLDHYFQNHAAPQAVRNRMAMVTAAIVSACEQSPNTLVRVASLGSGPALDVLRAALELDPQQRQRLHVTLLDLDPLALDAAKARLATVLADSQIVVRRENLYRLPQRTQTLGEQPLDLLVCTGFFDYLNQHDAAALLRLCWNSLSPSGRLMVFNFAPHNPSRGLMEWIGNWYLIYRDEQQMQDLALRAGLTQHDFQIQAEPLGIDLVIDARR